MKNLFLFLLCNLLFIVGWAQCSTPSNNSTQNVDVTLCSGTYSYIVFNKKVTILSGATVTLDHCTHPTANSSIVVSGTLNIDTYPSLVIGGSITHNSNGADFNITVYGANVTVNGNATFTGSNCQFGSDAASFRVKGTTTITGANGSYPTLYPAVDSFISVGTVTTNSYPWVDVVTYWDVPTGTTVNCHYTCSLVKTDLKQPDTGLQGVCYFKAKNL